MSEETLTGTVEAVTQKRTVETVTLEIKTLHQQAQQMVLSYAIEIGRRLVEVKAMLNHGEWGGYLKEQVSYSPSTANNFMRIFSEYGANQQSLFGGVAKSQTFGNLSYSKALALLALPEEEREDFAKEHEDLSTRELQDAIRAKEKAEADAAAAKANAAAAEESREKMQKDMEFLKEQADLYQRGREEADRAAGARERDKKELEQQVQKLRAELQAEKEKPVVVAVEKPSEEELEAIRQEAIRETAEKLKLTEEKLEQVQREAEQAQREAEQAQEKLKASSESKTDAISAALVGEFKAHFENAQKEYQAMEGILQKLPEQTAQKLRETLRTWAGTL